MFVRERKISDIVVSLGFGAAAGCLIGILYAPQAGRRTRRQVVSAIEDSAGHIKSTAERTGNYIRKKTSRLQTGANQMLDRGKTAIEKGKARMESSDLYRAAWR